MRGAIGLGLIVAALTAGCAANGCSGAQGYGGQQGVCNEKDHFSYGAQGTRDGSETYRWENTGASATVSWGTQGSGAFDLSVKDAAGTLVYTSGFSGGQKGGRDTTSTGEAGTWTIAFGFHAFEGQVGVSIDRA